MKIHTVKKGDTLSKIAKKFQVSVTEIQRVNQLKNLDHLLPGMKIKVPSRKVALPTRQKKNTKEQPTIVDQREQPVALEQTDVLEQTDSQHAVQPAHFAQDYEAEESAEVTQVTGGEEGKIVESDYPPIGPQVFARTADAGEDETKQETEREVGMETHVGTEDISFEELPSTGPSFADVVDRLYEDGAVAKPVFQAPAFEEMAADPEEVAIDEKVVASEVNQARDVQPQWVETQGEEMIEAKAEDVIAAKTEERIEVKTEERIEAKTEEMIEAKTEEVAEIKTEDVTDAVAVYFPPVGPTERSAEPKRINHSSHSTSLGKTGYRPTVHPPYPYMNFAAPAPYPMQVPMQPLSPISVPYPVPVTMAPVQPMFVPLTPMYLPPYHVTPHAMMEQENMWLGQFQHSGGVHRDSYLGLGYPGSSQPVYDRYPLEQMAKPEVWPSWGSLHDESSASN